VSLFSTTLLALAPLFLLILVGQVLRARGIVQPAQVPTLNGLVVMVTMPALIVETIVKGPRVTAQAFLLAACLLTSQLLVMALAAVIGRVGKLSSRTLGAFMMTSAFPNTGFLGYPITFALFPALFQTAVIVDQFGMSILMYVGGTLIGAHFGGSADPSHKWDRLRKLFVSPIFLSIPIGFAIRYLNWSPDTLASTASLAPAIPTLHYVAGVIGKCLHYLGQGTTPLVLIALGVALRPGLHGPIRTYAASVTLKLLVVPLVMWSLAYAAGFRGDLLSVGILLASMPTAVVSSVLAAEYNLDSDIAVGIVFLSTVLSAVTVPLLLAWLR
jgi:predicted permease